jgi:Tfp pilus assembly protein PilX
MRQFIPSFSTIGNERGMVLVSALLLLLIVSFMAVGMSTDTSMDVRIAGYQKYKAVSFGYAESAVNAGTEILEDNIYEAGWSGTDFPYPNLSDQYDPDDGITIVGSTNGDFYMDSNLGRNQTLKMIGDIEAGVVVQRIVSKLGGGAIQMAAGYEMLGKGAAGGGIHVIYNLEAEGIGAGQARSDVGMHYRHVTD